ERLFFGESAAPGELLAQAVASTQLLHEIVQRHPLGRLDPDRERALRQDAVVQVARDAGVRDGLARAGLALEAQTRLLALRPFRAQHLHRDLGLRVVLALVAVAGAVHDAHRAGTLERDDLEASDLGADE